MSLGVALFAGSAVMGLLLKMPFMEWNKAVLHALIALDTIALCGAVSMILILSHVLNVTGQFRRLLDNLRSIVGDVRILYFSFPALIGLLPMPGGSIFSAPMIDAAAGDDGPSAEQRSIINYWFRHIWEYSWPLYPGLLLAAQLMEVPVRRVVFLQMPFTLLAAITGIWVLLRKMDRGRLHHIEKRAAVVDILRDLSPILVTILLVLVVGMNMLVALAIAILITLFINQIPFRRAVVMIVVNRKLATMAFMVLGIMAFKVVLNDSGAIDGMTSFLQDNYVPLVVLLAVLPFVTGMVTGLTVAYVGITYPILIQVCGGVGTPGLAGSLSLAFASGFIGVLLSPVHLCLIMSNGYFKADAGKVYKLILKMSFIIFISALLLYYGYKIYQ